MSTATSSPFSSFDLGETKKIQNEVVEPLADKQTEKAQVLPLPEPLMIPEEEEYFFYEI